MSLAIVLKSLRLMSDVCKCNGKLTLMVLWQY